MYVFFLAKKEALGNAIALIIVEIIKVAWRLYQVFHGQITWKEFAEKTIRSLVNGFMSAAFSRAFLSVVINTPHKKVNSSLKNVAGLLGSILGPLIGKFLSKLLLDQKLLGQYDSESNDDIRITH